MMRRLFKGPWMLALVGCLWATPLPAQELGQEGYADSNGVKIHYVTLGKGPLVVMLHGFPDYWYTWRDQMPALAKHFQVVAIDLRGYNKSDQPEGVENYAIDKLVGDVEAVLRHFKRDKAIIVGHDWGGAVAWTFAMTHPDKTDRLVVLNLPHPKGLMRELANNPQQQKNSEYARDFQQPDAHKKLTPEAPRLLGQGTGGPEAVHRSVQALVDRGDAQLLQGQLSARTVQGRQRISPGEMPGADDPRAGRPVSAAGGLNDTWKWLENDLTLVTVPKAGHFVHRDATEVVNKAMVRWLRTD